MGAGWVIRRHPWTFAVWVALVTTLTLAGRWWAALGLFGVVMVPALAGSFAGRRWPETWRKYVRAPRERRKWKRRARKQWDDIADKCGLSQQTRRTRWKRRNGKWKKLIVTTVRRPKLRRPKARGNTLLLTIRHRRGQTNSDVIKAVEQIVSTLGAVEWATSEPNLQVVVIEAIMRDDLGRTVYAKMPVKLRQPIGTVDLGRRQDGERWILRVRGQHTLVLGCTGAGKNSVLGGILGGLAPGVVDRTVALWGVDFGGGIEFAPMAGTFTHLARDIESGVGLMRDLKVVMIKRQEEMMAHNGRLHSPQPGSPLIVLAIDELAAALYDATPTGVRLAKEFNGILGLLLTQGRKLGISVLAAQQDPRKDLLALRDRFTTTVCLRTKTAAETTLALGPGHNIPAHNIREDRQGTGYLIEEASHTVKVRADYTSDQLLVAIGQRWRPPIDVTSLQEAPPVVEPRRRSHAALTARQPRRGTAEHNAELMALGVSGEPDDSA